MSSEIDIKSIAGLEEWRSSLKSWIGTAWADLQLAEVEVRRVEEHIRDRSLYWVRQVERYRLETRVAEQRLRDCRSSEDDCAEEEDALESGRQSLRNAEQELGTTKYWAKKLQAAAGSYRFSANRMRKTLQSDIPHAIGVLEAMIAKFREGKAVEITSATTSAVSDSTIEEAVGQDSVRGLSDTANSEIESLISQGKKQEALERCLAEMKSAFPDISDWLDTNPQFRIDYDPQQCKEQENTAAVTRFDIRTMTPLDMAVGNLAYTSVASLHSTLGHEFTHMRRILTTPPREYLRDSHKVKARWEFEAYAWEIENADITGLSNYPDDLISIREYMIRCYDSMSDSDKALYLAEKEKCIGMVDQFSVQSLP